MKLTTLLLTVQVGCHGYTNRETLVPVSKSTQAFSLLHDMSSLGAFALCWCIMTNACEKCYKVAIKGHMYSTQCPKQGG